ncbi:serine hydrolase domain-containing protein [Chryseobacterium sp. c4a]|uniref:serine hydrolase domain-containing protein n=1 Tax=Chryseobacterium sp. c4a TaxID=1573582 RepID=UPI0016244246|nr:serine hydrolase domain-containing protein [Chryseobacterium sp. c4a]
MKRDPLITQQLQSLLNKYSKDKPGFTFMAKYDDGVYYEGAAGLASLSPKKSMKVNDVFNLASVSKQFTAFAILLLEKDKKLSLDDSIYKFMPELGEYVKPVTISNLVHHTGGVSDYMQLADEKGMIYGEDILTSEESLKHLYELTKTEFLPGSKFDYSNTGYFLLAQIVEKTSGMSIKEFSRTRIFEPLGMKSTFIVDQYPITRDYVLSYDKEGKVHQVQWNHTGDGAVHSNVHDLMLWGENIATGKVGGKDLVKKFATPFSPITTDGKQVEKYEPYACGISESKIQNENALEHSGGWESYETNFIRIPGKKLTIAVLANNEEVDAINISHEIAKILLQ